MQKGLSYGVQPDDDRLPFSYPPAGAFHEMPDFGIDSNLHGKSEKSDSRNPYSLREKFPESIPIDSDFEGAGCHPNLESIPIDSDFEGAAVPYRYGSLSACFSTARSMSEQSRF